MITGASTSAVAARPTVNISSSLRAQAADCSPCGRAARTELDALEAIAEHDAMQSAMLLESNSTSTYIEPSTSDVLWTPFPIPGPIDNRSGKAHVRSRDKMNGALPQ